MAEPHDILHHHHHHEDEEELAELDPAQQSLADALRWTFRLLKWAMVIMLVIYLFSGIFNIREQEAGIRLRFGQIVETGIGGEILEAGGPYFAWPFPIEQVVRIPTDIQQVELHKAFWFEIHKSQATQTEDDMAAGRPGPLNPEKDGFLLSGDANICHARFSLTYQITKPTDFIENIGDPTSKQKMLDAAELVIRNAAEQGIVATVAQLTADRFQKGLTAGDVEIARNRIQDVLDALQSGIEVLTISADRTIFPLSVRRDFQAVTEAESERAKLIEAARQYRDETLGKTAGESAMALLEVIEEYEHASGSQDAVAQAALDDQLDSAFNDLTIETDRGPRRIGGEVALVMNEAKTYRTQVVAEVRGESEYFESLLPHYRQNPDIVLSRLWQDAIEEILPAGDEMIWLPKGHIRIKIARDAELQKKREREQIQKQQEERLGR